MVWTFWQAPDRDSVTTLDKVDVAIVGQTRLLLQMEGARGTVDADVLSRTGTELKRARRPHKLLERMGVLHPDASGNTRLTDLGRALRQVPETQQLRRQIADAAIRILAKYQLRNPVDDSKGDYPDDSDIHPYWAIWKACVELDWKLHWDELNRVLFHVLRHADLDDAIDNIRLARQQQGYEPTTDGTVAHPLGARAYDQDDAPANKTPDGQVRDQKTTPWFKRAGFGELLLSSPGATGAGYWTIPEDMRELLKAAVQKSPPFYEFRDTQDWYQYFGSFDAWAKAPSTIDRAGVQAIADAFSQSLSDAGLRFGAMHERFVRAFLASLVSKRFVILAGLSGSGKTQIAQKLGQWLGPEHYDVVPVRPDWTGPEPLLGYEDALVQRDDGIPVWSVPRVLEFCVRCRRDPLKPYLLLLDEMNLAHVEQYFADFLSGMESSEPVLPDVGWDPIAKHWLLLGRRRLSIPENLFVVGTVNVDETTYTFSPKVLDRAHTLEFRVLPQDLPKDVVQLAQLGHVSPGPDHLLAALLDVARDADWQANNPPDDSFGVQLATDLLSFHQALEPVGFEFGYRVVAEAGRFASLLHAMDPDANYDNILDRVVMQKLLPRLHGSRRRLERVLCLLAGLAHGGTASEDFDPLADAVEASAARLHVSFEKLKRMTRRLRADHFVSFAE